MNPPAALPVGTVPTLHGPPQAYRSPRAFPEADRPTGHRPRSALA